MRIFLFHLHFYSVRKQKKGKWCIWGMKNKICCFQFWWSGYLVQYLQTRSLRGTFAPLQNSIVQRWGHRTWIQSIKRSRCNRWPWRQGASKQDDSLRINGVIRFIHTERLLFKRHALEWCMNCYVIGILPEWSTAVRFDPCLIVSSSECLSVSYTKHIGEGVQADFLVLEFFWAFRMSRRLSSAL